MEHWVSAEAIEHRRQSRLLNREENLEPDEVIGALRLRRDRTGKGCSVNSAMLIEQPCHVVADRVVELLLILTLHLRSVVELRTRERKAGAEDRFALCFGDG